MEAFGTDSHAIGLSCPNTAAIIRTPAFLMSIFFMERSTEVNITLPTYADYVPQEQAMEKSRAAR